MVEIKWINFGTANISASAAGLIGDSQTVRVAATLFGPASAILNQGITQNLTFTLSAPSPSPLAMTLSSDNSTVAAVPASVTIPARGTTAVVPVTGAGAGSTVIRVSAPPSIAEKAVNITVVAPGSITLSNVSASPSRSHSRWELPHPRAVWW